MGANMTAVEYYGKQEYLAGTMQGAEDMDKLFPFDPSMSSEPIAEFKPVYGGDKVQGFTDVELFDMFSIVGPKTVKAANDTTIVVDRPLFKITKLNKVAKREIAKIEQDEHTANMARLTAFYQDPQNGFFDADGQAVSEVADRETGEYENNGQVSPFSDTMLDRLENGGDIHTSPFMVALLNRAMQEEIEAEESEDE